MAATILEEMKHTHEFWEYFFAKVNRNEVEEYFNTSNTIPQGKLTNCNYLYVLHFSKNKNATELVNYCARKGEVECLSYALEKGYNYDEVSCSFAAEEGNLECLRILHENGCPWNENAVKFAAQNGHLDCLKYLCESENSCPWNQSAVYFAVWNGHMDCLEYFHQIEPNLVNKFDWGSSLFNAAILADRIDIIEYLNDKGYVWDAFNCETAKLRGRLECLKYLVKNGCPYKYSN
jgi:hypothetical protein